MKKTLIVLTLGTAVAALLFAQNVQNLLDSKENAPAGMDAPTAVEAPVVEFVAPVAEAPAVEMPVKVEMPVAVVEKPQVEPAAQTDEIGISDDLATGSEMVSGRVSLSLKDVELQDVIRLFGKLSGANIIIPDLGEEVSMKKVDVNLDGVEWKPSLQAILDTHDLELYEKIPGTEVYSIREKAADAPEPMVVKLFKLNFATVDGVAEMITTMVPEPGKVSVFPARNTIVVQSTAANLVEVTDIINAIDLPRQQVFIEAKFLELTDRASEQLGIDWQVLGGYGIGVSDIGGSYNYSDSKSDTINNSRNRNWSDSTTASRSLAENRFSDIAGRPYENLEDDPAGAAIDYAARDGNDPGLERIFGITPTTASESLTESLSTTLNDSLSAITSLDQSTVTRALGATLSADDFGVVLAALKQINGTKVVSNPKIIVANEETAQIYIGQKEPNIKQQTTQAQNADAVTTYNLDPDMPYFEYGIKLDVTPTVNTADNIAVAIAPSLTRFVRDKTVGNGGTINSFPVTTEKTIQTIFSLQSGQTAAIGGLTESSVTDVDRKIPLLGSLPLIGRLFSYKSNVDEQTETIIFVTIGLANPDNINMETGLPQNSELAMRYEIKGQTDRQIRAEEQKLYQYEENERLQKRLQTLRKAQQKQLDSQKTAE